MAKFQLALLIHAHQPVGNFDDVMERAYQHSYLPFVQVLERHPAIRLGLNARIRNISSSFAGW